MTQSEALSHLANMNTNTSLKSISEGLNTMCSPMVRLIEDAKLHTTPEGIKMIKAIDKFRDKVMSCSATLEDTARKELESMVQTATA